MRALATISLVVLATAVGCSGSETSVAADGAVEMASFCAVLQGPGKEPLEGVTCVLCSANGCRSQSSDKAGKACLPVSLAGDYVFHATESKINGAHYGDVLFPVSISAVTVGQQGVQDLGTVTLSRMGPTSTLDPKIGGTFALGGGLTLTVPAGVATPPPLEKKIELAVARVDPANIHPNLLAVPGAGKSPALTFMFVPDEVAFSSPVSFEITGSGLPAGAALDIYWVDYKTARPKLHGEAKVAKDSVVADVKGKGLKLTGWFLFYAK